MHGVVMAAHRRRLEEEDESKLRKLSSSKVFCWLKLLLPPVKRETTQQRCNNIGDREK